MGVDGIRQAGLIGSKDRDRVAAVLNDLGRLDRRDPVFARQGAKQFRQRLDDLRRGERSWSTAPRLQSGQKAEFAL